MSTAPRPAPPWRRLIAAVYDGLLLIALWLVVLLLSIVLGDALVPMLRQSAVQQLLLLATGALFFAGFWTHGGQTLGMRAWRLQVRRLDGAALRWPIAILRFAVLLSSWGLCALPAISQLPALDAHPLGQPRVAVAVLIGIGAALLLMVLDARHRAPCDYVAGTEVVVLPKAP